VLAKIRVRADYRFTSATAERWVAQGFRES
jgi:hypothetical protein